MSIMKPMSLATALLLSLSAGTFAATPALDDIPDNAGYTTALITIPQPDPYQMVFQQQHLPPNNNEPGFQWPDQNKSAIEEDYILTGNAATFLKISAAQSSDLADGTGKCKLSPRTKYLTTAMPGFEGEHMTVTLKKPLPGCALTKGYVYMDHFAATSAGGAWQLPKNVRAFLDTLAYAEGTERKYNYIFTFVTFKSYADHPRKTICHGDLCSTAAGRYQYLSRTWDTLAQDLGLTDFTPPNQDRAVMEIIRRAGAYNEVANSSDYKNFEKALATLNGIWASLPGSPYGQPTYSTEALWEQYTAFLAKYQ